MAQEPDDRLLALVPPERRARLPGRVKAASSVASAYALLFALMRGEGFTEPPRLERGESGKPFFPGYPGLHFSISHTKLYAMCALSSEPIGCDVEGIRSVTSGARKKICSITGLRESGILNDAAIIRAWCAHEALVKYHGGSAVHSGYSMDGLNLRVWELPDAYCAACSPLPLTDCAFISAEELYGFCGF